MQQIYPIGTPGKPWGNEEKAQWKAQQSVKRSYQEEVLDKLSKIVPEGFQLKQYGALPYDEARYPLYAVVPINIDSNKPSALITGGVHGYETSGVQGALQFIEAKLATFKDLFNIVVVPCVSPWGYETINRWNPLALDPNRSFYPGSPAPESAQLIKLVNELALPLALHIDLHETTDTDNSEFRPALAARDGVTHDNWNIPDGFYTVANTSSLQLEFQKAVIDAVKDVTHIAPADENGKIIGADVVSEGVICYDKKALSLCGGLTDAKYVTTTEVYPDSDNATPENCNEAQVSAICAALDFIK
ncbi:M14 family metallocarboxypeptidase [Alteromonas mediterranea]|uniref:M14 family metallopeptidase n=1 Tax=Alteromonas mediterranea TaxID=314275 RepID=UPI001130A026|nr:M14 family metallocarboxypeptidase [Alteromonas mediterranea]QDG37975.1 M14 family metallocarboxypeptidase [Alteromonas mediterranea]